MNASRRVLDIHLLRAEVLVFFGINVLIYLALVLLAHTSFLGPFNPRSPGFPMVLILLSSPIIGFAIFKRKSAFNPLLPHALIVGVLWGIAWVFAISVWRFCGYLYEGYPIRLGLSNAFVVEVAHIGSLVEVALIVVLSTCSAVVSRSFCKFLQVGGSQ